jgi:hypothetical protein
VGWTQDGRFDYELAGPRMLGHDICRLLDKPGWDLVAAVLLNQVDPDMPGLLPNEMNPNDPGRVFAWLNALLGGLLHTEISKP